MSDFIGHNCGLALVRLRKPLTWYRDQYGDPRWGLRQLYLLMEKQHNRGQDGAGIATVKTAMPPGEKFMLRVRSHRRNAIERIFDVVMENMKHADPDFLRDLDDVAMKQSCEFLGNVYLGHLRYGTHSGYGRSYCSPIMRRNNRASRNLALGGNFNMTNSQELFQQLVEYGLNPVGESDTQVILERIGYCLDQEHERLRDVLGPDSEKGLQGRELTAAISEELDLVRVLQQASQQWDGGYVFAGLVGNGDSFICRDPAGIRPCYVIVNDEIIAAASERAALSSVFNLHPDEIRPLSPGHVLVAKQGGAVIEEAFTEARPVTMCTFERLYFSRGNDPDIYRERKRLGYNLAIRALEAIDWDVEHAIFSFIPNTGETASLGLVEEVDRLVRRKRADELWSRIETGTVTREELDQLTQGVIRTEKIAHKDQRLRTFITHDAARRDLVMHIYDITRGIVSPDDTLVVLDDSIVRGTTLRESILTILSRLEPKRIIILSSSPPIMYPDCYGIDMSRLSHFIAFEAAVALLYDRGEEALLKDIEARCVEQEQQDRDPYVNHVRDIYDRFSLEELSGKISELVSPKNVDWQGSVDVIYQTVEGLRAAMPGYEGDWYFSGNYPTPGGYRVLNRAYLNWCRNDDSRPY